MVFYNSEIILYQNKFGTFLVKRHIVFICSHERNKPWLTLILCPNMLIVELSSMPSDKLFTLLFLCWVMSWFWPLQGVVTNFEIFRMREKQVPVDVVEMKGNAKYFFTFELNFSVEMLGSYKFLSTHDIIRNLPFGKELDFNVAECLMWKW